MVLMGKKEPEEMLAKLTPLEKIESLYAEIVEWYGEADKKEQRAAAKLLMVGLDKFAIYEGDDWYQLVMEYIDILKNDPDRFQKILQSNRGESKTKQSPDKLH